MLSLMKKLNFSMLPIFFIVFFSVSLQASSRVRCGELHVRILTTPDKHCVLTHTTILHGHLAGGSIIPAAITHTPDGFVMLQTIYGPDLELAYKCNNAEPVSIHMSQEYCFVRGGVIRASSSSPDVHVSKLEGSYLFDTPGSVTWIL